LPCLHASATPAGACGPDEQDGFTLIVRVDGGRLCAAHSVSVHAGGHYDAADDAQPSITGRTSGNDAAVRFESAFGGTGTATLRVHGNSLQWQVVTQDGNESWIPLKAQLHRIPARRFDRMPSCGR
jgi:hypothetical protein